MFFEHQRKPPTKCLAPSKCYSKSWMLFIIIIITVMFWSLISIGTGDSAVSKTNLLLLLELTFWLGEMRKLMNKTHSMSAGVRTTENIKQGFGQLGALASSWIAVLKEMVREGLLGILATS